MSFAIRGPTLVNCPTQPTCIAHCVLCICQLSRRWQPSLALSKMFEPFLRPRYDIWADFVCKICILVIWIGGFRWKLLEKLLETTRFSRFSTTSNSVFDLGSSSSTTVNSISLSTTLIFVFIHEAQSHAIHSKGDIANSLEWWKFLFNGGTKTKPIHAPSPSFLIRIQYYGLVCSLNDWRYRNDWVVEPI